MKRSPRNSFLKFLPQHRIRPRGIQFWHTSLQPENDEELKSSNYYNFSNNWWCPRCEITLFPTYLYVSSFHYFCIFCTWKDLWHIYDAHTFPRLFSLSVTKSFYQSLMSRTLDPLCKQRLPRRYLSQTTAKNLHHAPSLETICNQNRKHIFSTCKSSAQHLDCNNQGDGSKQLTFY